MWPIKIVDKSGQASHQTPLEYVIPSSQASYWTEPSIEGTIKAVMCDACGLVNLYGMPKGWNEDD